MISRRAPELIFRIEISEFCDCTFVSFILSTLVGGPVVFSSDFAGVEGIAARGVFRLSPDSVHNFVRSVGLFRIISDCTANPVKTFFAYSRSVEVDRLREGCVRSYPYNAATVELSPLSSRSIHSQKQAADGFSITHKVRQILIYDDV